MNVQDPISSSPIYTLFASDIPHLLLPLLFLCLISHPVDALKAPGDYGYNECELVAKDFQKAYGGSLIFIAPKSWDTGKWVICDYCGHFVNKKYISGNKKEFYFDWQYQKIFASEEELKDWYSHEFSGYDCEIFDLGAGERPPYNLIWHY